MSDTNCTCIADMLSEGEYCNHCSDQRLIQSQQKQIDLLEKRVEAREQGMRTRERVAALWEKRLRECEKGNRKLERDLKWKNTQLAYSDKCSVKLEELVEKVKEVLSKYADKDNWSESLNESSIGSVKINLGLHDIWDGNSCHGWSIANESLQAINDFEKEATNE